MIFTSAMRWALPTYITRLLGARRPQSLGSELTTIPSTINHPDKGVSLLLTRARPARDREPEERPAAPRGARGWSRRRFLPFLPPKMRRRPEGAKSWHGNTGAAGHGGMVGTVGPEVCFLAYLVRCHSPGPGTEQHPCEGQEGGTSGLTNNPRGKAQGYPHCTDRETEAQPNPGLPQVVVWRRTALGLESRLPGPCSGL